MRASTSVVNNVNLGRIAESVENAKEDSTTLRKRVRLHGEWALDTASTFQFKTDVEYEEGTQRIEIDSPSFLGGKGSRLGPTNYCVVGMASCFALTFAILAARQGVRLSKLAIDAECNLNFGKYLDVNEEPVVEEVRFRVTAESSDATREKLSELIRMAEERCPAVYMLVHSIRVQAELA
jgi:uncharacterized OsmC-like protein